MLDVSSTSKGILLPRLTTTQRDEISNPVNGLLIFNETTLNFNYYNSEWKDFSPRYNSVNSITSISSNSVTDVPVSEMILSPVKGYYSVTFEGEISNTDVPIPNYVNSSTLLTDLNTLYNDIMNFSPINAHAATYGGNEVILPGRYDVAGAISVSGIMTLDGLGNPNSVFIFHSGGALNFAANASILLTNGASPENVFWIGEGAVGVGADASVYGNLISHGAALAVGANSNVFGRLLTNTGAIAFGPAVCTVPANQSSVFNLGTLQTFVIFTGSGAISNTGGSVYNGNICSGAGDTSSLCGATVNGILVPPSQNTNLSGVEIQTCIATFGMYQNGVLIPSSIKKITCNAGYTNVSLSAIAVVDHGHDIVVKWKISSGTLNLGNRVLTSIKVQ